MQPNCFVAHALTRRSCASAWAPDVNVASSPMSPATVPFIRTAMVSPVQVYVEGGSQGGYHDRSPLSQQIRWSACGYGLRGCATVGRAKMSSAKLFVKESHFGAANSP